ncbi:hypothetical protein G6F68_019808 [Rhizopus microsporus]|nr:hypothetical protein G6F68_019808 [Rhizopus microsporus]
MNVTYPVIEDEVIDFCRDKRAVLLLEEGQPDYIEQNLHAVLRKAGIDTHLSGKDVLPMAGDATARNRCRPIRPWRLMRKPRPASWKSPKSRARSRPSPSP